MNPSATIVLSGPDGGYQKVCSSLSLFTHASQALITEAFIGLIGIISLVPIIGPIIGKILALPLFWLFNSLGYFLSIIAIKKGYSKPVISYRILTIVFLFGIVIGFVIGKLL